MPGMKMVKNKDGKMVPFFAADGKGKMKSGGKPKKAAKKKAKKMAYGGKSMTVPKKMGHGGKPKMAKKK